MLSTLIAASATTLALSAAPPPAMWTTVPPMFYSEIVQKADVIVTGTVQRSETRYENGRATIRTYVTLGDLTFHKGQPRQSLTLRLEGGQIGDDRLVVPGMPHLDVGKRYFLYVDGTRHPEKVSPIVGFYQGAFEVVQNDGRQVLLNMDGQELVGVQNDRFVFRSNAKPEAEQAPKAPEIVLADATVKWADPNADAIEEQMLAEQRRKAELEMQRNPLPQLGRGSENVAGADGAPAPAAASTRIEGRDRSLAMPIVLDAQSDPGTRASIADLLNAANTRR